MRNVIDMVGFVSGRLTVIARAQGKRKGAYWECLCECGKRVIVYGRQLREHSSKSCGCYQRDRMAAMGTAQADDLTGMRFGKLIAVSSVPYFRHRKRGWVCKCDCGNTHTVATQLLKDGRVQSCGCLHRQPITGSATFTHGHAPRGKISPTYITWENMKARCFNPRNNHYKDYGGRGITVCDRWLKFENFLSDMGPKPFGLSIERMNNNGNYEPSNCKWATRQEQAHNTRRNRWITFKGERLRFSEWAQRLGITYTSLYRRLKLWPLDKALTQPKRGT